VRYYLITTIGQLIFFRWAIMFGLINYCEQNVASIEAHLREVKAQTKKQGKRRKFGQTSLSKDEMLDD
jgi:hypothetical protein